MEYTITVSSPYDVLSESTHVDASDALAELVRVATIAALGNPDDDVTILFHVTNVT